MSKHLLWVVFAMLTVTGCHIRHDVKMEPIEITLNINLKVDRELDNFFDDIDQAAATDLAADKQPVKEEQP